MYFIRIPRFHAARQNFDSSCNFFFQLSDAYKKEKHRNHSQKTQRKSNTRQQGSVSGRASGRSVTPADLLPSSWTNQLQFCLLVVENAEQLQRKHNSLHTEYTAETELPIIPVSPYVPSAQHSNVTFTDVLFSLFLNAV